MSAKKFDHKIPAEPKPMPSSDSDDESFVVLGTSLSLDEDLSENKSENETLTCPVIQEAKELIDREITLIQKQTMAMPEMDKLSLNSTQSLANWTTMSSELPVEEVQAKIETLLAENLHLKGIIADNNATMKTQYDRMVSWQGRIHGTYESHKEKFAEAKEYIAKLKKENERLRLEMEKAVEIRQLQDEELLHIRMEMNNLRGKPTVASPDTSLEDKIISLQNKVEELSAESAKYSAENDKLMSTLEGVAEERNLMDEELSKLRVEMNDLRDRPTVTNPDTLLKEKITSLQKTIEELGAEKTQYYFELQRATNANLVFSNDIRNLTADKDKLTSDLESVVEKRKLQDEEISKLRLEINILRGLPSVANLDTLLEEKITALQSKIKELSAESTSYYDAYQAAATENLKLTDKINLLTVDNDKLMSALESMQSSFEIEKHQNSQKENKLLANIESLRTMLTLTDDHREEIDNMRLQLMNAQTVITKLEETLAAKEMEIDAKRQQLTNTQEQVQELASLRHELFALRNQVELYQNDYVIEKQQKETIKADKELMTQDLTNLERRIQELLGENEALRQQLNETQAEPQGAHAASARADDQDDVLKCPMCNFGFADYQALENHVNRCLDMDASLP